MTPLCITPWPIYNTMAYNTMAYNTMVYSTMASEHIFAVFDSVCRCQALVENKMYIPFQLVSKEQCEVV